MDSDDVTSYGVTRKVERKLTVSASTFKRIVEHVREKEREREREREREYSFPLTCSNHSKLR